VTPSQARAVAAAVAAEEKEAALDAPIRVKASSSESRDAGSAPVVLLHRAGYGVSVQAGAVRANKEADSATSLDVSSLRLDAGEGDVGALKPTTAPRPVVIGSFKPMSSGATGKLGAKRLGAKASSAPSFDFDAAEAAPPSPAAKDTENSGGAGGVGSKADEDALANALAGVEKGDLPRGIGGYHSKGGSSSSSSSSAPSDPKTFDKYKNAKGISSDMLFAAADNEKTRADKEKLQSFGDQRAISSDMLWGGGGAGGSGSSSSGGGSGGGRFENRASSGEGLGEFMEKLGTSVTEDLRKMAGTLGTRAAKAKEGLSVFFEALGGR